MVTILMRTVIIYLILLITMRLMGKRQIGELEVSELVTTLLLSEIATLPITEPEIPVMYAIIPIITLLTLEVFFSFILIKIPLFKRILTSKPNIIIDKGCLRQKELRRIRMSNEELLSELRRAGISDISDVYYAVIEDNGKLSVIQRTASRQPTASQLGLTVPECGMCHILISDGHIDKQGMKSLNVSKEELDGYLAQNRCSADRVFLLLKDDGGKFTIILKDEYLK